MGKEKVDELETSVNEGLENLRKLRQIEANFSKFVL